jgi:hypothetical protein
MKPLSAFGVILAVCGCAADTPPRVVTAVDAPKLTITEPKPKAVLKLNKSDKSPRFHVIGEVVRRPEGWNPALVLVKVTESKNQRLEWGSFAEAPKAQSNEKATFDFQMAVPNKKGKYKVIAIAMGEIPNPAKPGSTNPPNKTVKTDPVVIEIEVDGP